MVYPQSAQMDAVGKMDTEVSSTSQKALCSRGQVPYPASELPYFVTLLLMTSATA